MERIVNGAELEKAGMDLSELLIRLMDNDKLVSMFVKKFLEDRNFQKLVEAVEKGDMAEAEMASHTLKGMCGNLSMTDLYPLFTKQVQFLRDGDTTSAIGMMPEITAAYENSVTHMRKWLETQS